jgi:hypothetical protein
MGLKAFQKALIKHLKPETKIVEVDAPASDPLFVMTVLSLFDEMMGIVSTP